MGSLIWQRTNRYANEDQRNHHDQSVKDERIQNQQRRHEDDSPTPPLYNESEPLCFVIGSGIDASHREFHRGQVLELSDPSNNTTPILQRSTFKIPTDVSEDELTCWAHETDVASIIGGKRCGVAPGTKLVDVRVLQYDEAEQKCTFNEPDLERRFRHIKMFLEANPNSPAVINMCFGNGDRTNIRFNKCKCTEEWRYPQRIYRYVRVDRIIQEIYHLGALVIAAAGNDCAPAYTSWPSSNPYVLSVGALDRNGNDYELSNFGAAVGLLARGVDVRVAHLPPDGYDFVSGTSFAAPYVTGYACLALNNASTRLGLQTKELRPGALKSILFARFQVEQVERVQLSYMRSRSDGDRQDDEDDSKDDNEFEVDGCEGDLVNAGDDSKDEDIEKDAKYDAKDGIPIKEERISDNEGVSGQGIQNDGTGSKELRAS